MDEKERAADEKETRRRLQEALNPLGIELRTDSETKFAYWLEVHAENGPHKVGVAIVVLNRADIVLWDTIWIGLHKPISIAFQPYTSAERMFDIINERLVRALSPHAPKVKAAGSSEHRYILCPNREANHGFTVTVHTRVGGAVNARRWRCDECHYDIVVP